jgi:hypothetical protein
MSNPSAVILIVNCTASKSKRCGEGARLGQIFNTGNNRFRRWHQLLSKQTRRFVARDLYCGDGWMQALKAYDVLESKGVRVQFWIASAGLGLICAETRVPQYSATFSPDSEDSISRSQEECREWWIKLAEHRILLGEPGTLQNLAEANKDAIFLISLSATYLRILKNDLIAARRLVNSPDQFLIISAGTNSIPDLGVSLLPVDARFESKVGGARHTVNNRVAAFIVETFDTRNLNARYVSSKLTEISAKLPQLRQYSRVSLTDNQVLKKIAGIRKKKPDCSPSTALREFRDSGNACERKRFHRLFSEYQQ